MDGAAQKFIPVEEDRGVLGNSQRQSKRKRGLDPADIAIIEATSIELKSLVSKGGRRGRISEAHSDWSFFPKSSVQNTNILNFLPDSNVQEASEDVTVDVSVMMRKI